MKLSKTPINHVIPMCEALMDPFRDKLAEDTAGVPIGFSPETLDAKPEYRNTFEKIKENVASRIPQENEVLHYWLSEINSITDMKQFHDSVAWFYREIEEVKYSNDVVQKKTVEIRDLKEKKRKKKTAEAPLQTLAVELRCTLVGYHKKRDFSRFGDALYAEVVNLTHLKVATAINQCGGPTNLSDLNGAFLDVDDPRIDFGSLDLLEENERQHKILQAIELAAFTMEQQILTSDSRTRDSREYARDFLTLGLLKGLANTEYDEDQFGIENDVYHNWKNLDSQTMTDVVALMKKSFRWPADIGFCMVEEKDKIIAVGNNCKNTFRSVNNRIKNGPQAPKAEKIVYN